MLSRTAYRIILISASLMCTSLALAETVRLDVLEDEAVVSGDLADQNFSALSYRGGLYIGVASDALWTGRSYLKFDLSGLDSPVTSARLWLYLTQKFDEPDRPVGAYLTTDDWSEATLTWNNAPAPVSGPVDSAQPPFAALQWYCWDVTALVQQEAAGDGILSMLLKEIEESLDPCTWNYYAEREYNGQALAPHLEIQYGDYEDPGAPPALILPDDQTVEQQTPQGSEVHFEVSAIDCSGMPVDVVATPASGSLFPAGETTVAVSATDGAGKSSAGSFEVTVADTTPPVLSLPEDMLVPQQIPAGAVVEFAPEATDVVDPHVTVTCEPPSGSIFPVGTTIVNVTATDYSGNEAIGAFGVTVEAATAPTFALTTLEPTLWPPNHKMRLAATVSNVRDDLDPDPQVIITVTSNEPINGIGDGSTEQDWEIVRRGAVWEIFLRAERAGPSDGREYLIQVTVTNAAGISAQDQTTVTCPEDQGGGRWKGK